MQCESILLEPVYNYTLEVPTKQLGRAMSDIQKMYGTFGDPVTEGEHSILTGSVPAATTDGYQRKVSSYTGGQGRFSCVFKGYEPCHNTEEVMRQIGYDPDRDQENPSSSVFCAHGAGYLVSWPEVAEHAHVECGRWKQLLEGKKEDEAETENGGKAVQGFRPGTEKGDKRNSSDYITQEEIEQIFRQTYKKSPQDFAPYRYHGRDATDGLPEKGSIPGKQDICEKDGVGVKGSGKSGSKPGQDKRDAYLLVDGYNIIFAWEDLRSLSEVNIDSARDRLMDICCNYQGYAGVTLILVFDAYKVKGNVGSVLKYHNIYVVYTKEAETADQYIEKTVHRIASKADVTVATSDRLEQIIIWGEGAYRLSANGFREAVEEAGRRMRKEYQKQGKVFSKICLPESKE